MLLCWTWEYAISEWRWRGLEEARERDVKSDEIGDLSKIEEHLW